MFPPVTSSQRLSNQTHICERRLDSSTATGCALREACARPQRGQANTACRGQFGEAVFEQGVGSARFDGGQSDAGLAAVPLKVKSQWLGWRTETKRLRSQLQSYGVAGLLAYGLLNTLYYSAAFLIIWIYFAKVPKGLGWPEACKQFATVMSLTWAASQVTKVPRAALALFLAPVADGSLIFLQARLRLRTRRNAFIVVVALCLLLAAAVFGITVAAWA